MLPFSSSWARTKLSGTRIVGREEDNIGGQILQSFEYSLDGQELECEIRNQSAGPLKITLTRGGRRSVYEIGGQGSIVKLTTRRTISRPVPAGRPAASPRRERVVTLEAGHSEHRANLPGEI